MFLMIYLLTNTFKNLLRRNNLNRPSHISTPSASMSQKLEISENRNQDTTLINKTLIETKIGNREKR